MPVRPEEKIRCSFCGKNQDQVRKMIAGSNGVYICDECIELCSEILEEELGNEEEERPDFSGINLLKPKEIKEFLDDYVRRVRVAKETNAHSRQIQNICDYISLHIREPLSISLLSERLGYTEYYFSHKFKEVTGLSVNAYIRRKKIEEAKLLLSGTCMSIQDISDELSFGSRSFFFSSFQKETGMSPTAYRREHCKG